MEVELVRAAKIGLGKVRHSAEETGSVEGLGQLKDLLKLEYLEGVVLKSAAGGQRLELWRGCS